VRSLAITAAFPGQFEFEMRFRSVWVQRLPFFAQVIAIFEKELETIDAFVPFFQLVMSLNPNTIELGFSPNPLARNRG
jgi:hypothetical protein